MVNYSSKILGNAVSGVRAQQGVIATIGNNIANVNTAGYSRRIASLETRTQTGIGSTDLSVGNGVDLANIQRQVDEFIEIKLQQANADSQSAEVVNTFMGRIEELFSLNGESETIGNTLTRFFDSANNLSMNPSSIELRSAFLESGKSLVDSITTTYNALASLQTEANERIAREVITVNSLTEQIAGLNGQIAAIETGGVVANEERDKRGLLLNQLAEKISFSTVEVSDGTVSVTLENGFALVTGSSNRALSVDDSPSFAAGGPESLAGGSLSYIVYDYSNGAGTQQVDFTSFLKNQSGTIGGLLKMRGYVDPAETSRSAFNADGHIVEIASRVEAIARNLLTAINQSYLGPDRNTGTAGHQASAVGLNNTAPSVYGLFDFEYSGTKDANANGLPDDLNYTNFGNYSSRMQMAFTDPLDVAAGLDRSGATTGALVSVAGDGANIATLAGLRTQTYNFSVGNVSLSNITFDNAYQETITTVSNKRLRSETDLSIANSNLVTAKNTRDSISGVSLDEEFTQLLTAQKAFEASARMIKTAQTILDELLNLI